MNIKDYAFKAAYKQVFDEKDEIMTCGRQKCKELIDFANEIEPDVNHGDLKTGYMNVENIKALYNKIKSAQICN